MTTPPLTYHQKVFDLLQRTPTFDPNAEAKLRAVEEAYGLILPPSVREWYSLNEAIPILQESDDCSNFLTLEKMVENAPRWFAQKWLNDDDRGISAYKDPTIPFSWDICAGIGLSAIAVTDNYDSYVVNYVEEIEWYRSNNETFSEFILKWRYNRLYAYNGYQARAYNARLSEKDYQTIQQFFTEKTSISAIRIFEYEDQLIYSWYNWDKENKNTHLWIHAKTAQSYRDLLNRIWTTGNLATELQAKGSHECRTIFEEFRPRIVRNFPKEQTEF